jgi:hypothetical protein
MINHFSALSYRSVLVEAKVFNTQKGDKASFSKERRKGYKRETKSIFNTILLKVLLIRKESVLKRSCSKKAQS